MTQAATQPTRPQDLGSIQLSVNNIEVVYHDIVQVLRGVSLEVPKGKIVALLGTNGAGKTTTLKAISGLLKPENGSIRDGQVSFEGNRIDTLSAEGIVRRGIVQVPEGRRVFKHLSVEENLRVGSITGKGVAKDDLERMYTYFPRLMQLRHRQAGYCSGGEQQMLAISRALMAHPQMLLLDEPSLGIAPLLVKEIFERVKHINREMGVTVMVVEQNANVALSHADYGYIMESGRIVLEGTASELKDNPDVREFYLGVTEGGGRKSYRDVKSYKRRKRWM
jgi:branched-chain amino acid transport system ATP-binding protein